jgi:hypothetical protein
MLLGYGHNPAMQGRTVIVQTHVIDTDIFAPASLVRAWMAASGVNRVIVGHKPYGDTPTVLRANGVEIISADQGYSDPKRAAVSEVIVRNFAVLRSRGELAAQLSESDLDSDSEGAEVQPSGACGFSVTEIHGCDRAGRKFDFLLPILPWPGSASGVDPSDPKLRARVQRVIAGEGNEQSVPFDDLVGHHTADGWLVKARYVPSAAGAEAEYLLMRAVGPRSVEYAAKKRGEISLSQQ